MSELVIDRSEFTIGIVEDDIYRPLIMWNLAIKSYISENDSTYRAYGCEVYMQGRHREKKQFKGYIKEGDFHSFGAIRTAIVDQTHGELQGLNSHCGATWSPS